MKTVKKIALVAMGDDAWIGGIQYIINIIDAINEVSRKQEIEVHVFRHDHQKFGILPFKNIVLKFHEINKILPPYSFKNRLYWFLQRKFNKRINPRFENYLIKNKFDYVYPAFISSGSNNLNVGSWIADFQYYNYPDGHDEETTIEAERLISNICNKASKIVFSSNFCMNQAYHLFPISKGKSYSMPFTVYIDKNDLNVKDFASIGDKYGITQPFFMVSNLFAKVKNHITLFRALKILKDEGLSIPVVFTGNFVDYSQMEFTNELLQVINETGIRHQLYILGLIPRKDQLALYRMSLALIQPSMHEGWSTCVEEAKCLGKDIILSDIEVHKEQLPENKYFFNVKNENDLALKIKDCYLLNKDSTQSFEEEREAYMKYRKNVSLFGENFMKIASR